MNSSEPENGVSFSINKHAAWAPGMVSDADWDRWLQSSDLIAGEEQPQLAAMPPMLRRRVGFLGKMALEVAYQCVGERKDIPTVFCSRHGEVSRAIDLLNDLARDVPLSPTSFGLAVHNASAGMFSIARKDRANHIALAAGASSVEHAVIDACGLLSDGAPEVLLVVYDNVLPDLFTKFQDCIEQPFAWAWLMAPAAANAVRLSWSAADELCESDGRANPAGLDVLRFQLGASAELIRQSGRQRWRWSRDA